MPSFLCMTKRRIGSVLSLAVLLAALPALAERPRPFSGRTVTNAPDLEEPIPGRIELSEDSMRFEVTRDGVSTVLLAGPHIEGVVMLVPDQQVALEMPNPPDGPPEIESVDPNAPCEGREGIECRKLRNESLAGRDTQVWEISEGENTSTIWIDQELRFPIRVQEADGHSFEIRDVKVGAPPAERFQVPNDYRRMQMPTDGHGEPVPEDDGTVNEVPGTESQ